MKVLLKQSFRLAFFGVTALCSLIYAEDKILSFDAPKQVISGQILQIPVTYEATAYRNLQINLQLNRPPYTGYGNKMISVAPGKNTVIIEFQIKESIPLARGSYNIGCYLIPSKGSWKDRLDEVKVRNLSCVSEGSVLMGNDRIMYIDGAPQVTPNGEAAAVSVTYEVSAPRLIQVDFLQSSSPWTCYGTKVVRVPKGRGEVVVYLTVSPSTPPGKGAYTYAVSLLPESGGESKRLDYKTMLNIDCLNPLPSVDAMILGFIGVDSFL